MRNQDEASAALLGAVLGGAASMAGVFTNNYVTSRLESKKQKWSGQQAQIERLRLHVADLSRLMFRVEYLIYALCWMAAYLPQRLDDKRTESYERDMERLMPELSGAIVVLSGLDSTPYETFREWVDKLNVFDGDVRLLIYQERTDNVLNQLAKMVEPLQNFYHTLPDEIGPLLKEQDRRGIQ